MVMGKEMIFFFLPTVPFIIDITPSWDPLWVWIDTYGNDLVFGLFFSL